MGRVKVYAILSKHFSSEDAEAIMDYIDEKRAVTPPLLQTQQLIRELELKIMKKTYKLEKRAVVALFVIAVTIIMIIRLLAHMIDKIPT